MPISSTTDKFQDKLLSTLHTIAVNACITELAHDDGITPEEKSFFLYKDVIKSKAVPHMSLVNKNKNMKTAINDD